MGRLVKRKVIEETFEVPVEEDELDGTDEAENDDDEAIDEEVEPTPVPLSGAKKSRARGR